MNIGHCIVLRKHRCSQRDWKWTCKPSGGYISQRLVLQELGVDSVSLLLMGNRPEQKLQKRKRKKDRTCKEVLVYKVLG